MPYSDIPVYDCATKETTITPVTNQWVLDHKPRAFSLSLDAIQVGVGGFTTLHIQLVTPLLIDDTRQNVSESITDVLSIEHDSGDVIETTIFNIDLDVNGYASVQLNANETGTYTISGHILTAVVDIQLEVV